MPYIHITRTPGVRIDDYERVLAEMGPDAIAGQLLHMAGEHDGVLHTVDVWQTKAHADRFASERLFPAFERAGVAPGAGHDHFDFDGSVVVGSPTGR